MEEGDYQTTYELEETNWWFAGMRAISLGLIDDVIASQPGPMEMLDVGCGTGIMLQSLAAHGSVTGLDVSALALGFCRRRGLGRLVRGSGSTLPFADGALDLVTAFGVIEHLEDDAAAVAEWQRVLRPGGSLVLNTSAYPWLWSAHDVSNHHYRRYYRSQVVALLEAHSFAIDVASYANTLLFLPIAAVRLVERVVRAARRSGAIEPRKDTGEVPALANRLLTWMLRAEGAVLRRAPLPFGVSIVVRARRV